MDMMITRKGLKTMTVNVFLLLAAAATSVIRDNWTPSNYISLIIIITIMMMMMKMMMMMMMMMMAMTMM